MDLDALVKALSAARGCGCCASMDDLAALVPCGPACSADEDGWVDHTYEDGCSRRFRDAARRVIERLIEEACEPLAGTDGARVAAVEALVADETKHLVRWLDGSRLVNLDDVKEALR